VAGGLAVVRGRLAVPGAMTPASRIFRPDALAGQVALVTGGGTNLGRQAAAELLACGARVLIAGRREEVLAEAARDLGEGCSYVAGDIRDPAAGERLVRAAVAHHGRLDTLVNNAGGQYFVPAEGITAKGWNAVLRLNVGGTLAMMRAAAEHGFGPAGGMVVNVTVSPHHGMPAMAHTGAARAAVEALGREHAAAWAPRGIGVVGLAIGRFDTESLRKYPEVVLRGAARTVPLQRLGTMEEFGWTVALLASPLGRALSGSVVTLDGGVDNWHGPWPPEGLTDDAGSVPTESRAPRTQA
jgi:NAD(P)-dependent dehydrogenase (short-subunit alcohol dehydrogenase family)